MSRHLAVLLATLGLLLLLGGTPAAAHGAPTAPLSRSAACGQSADAGGPACVAARRASPLLTEQWDNVRVAGVGGRDRAAIPDGALCSAGLAKFRGLDLARPDWPATPLAAGSTQPFGYAGTIPHQGTFRLYLTRPGYAPDRPLTWSDLEPEPFVTVTDPPLEAGVYRFPATLPAGRSGRALIYTIWQNSSTPDTYYSCSDVDFGAPAPAAAAAPAPVAAAPPPNAPAPTAQPTTDDAGPLVIVAAAVAAVAAAGALVFRRVRRRSGPGHRRQH